MKEEVVVTEVKKGVKHIPCFSIRIYTDTCGLWDWNVVAFEGSLKDNKIKTFDRDDREPRTFVMKNIQTIGLDIEESDPIPTLYKVVNQLSTYSTKPFPRIVLEGEWEFTTIDIVCFTKNTVALYMEREDSVHDDTFSYSFLVDRKELRDAMYKALCTFSIFGGWYKNNKSSKEGDKLLHDDYKSIVIE